MKLANLSLALVALVALTLPAAAQSCSGSGGAFGIITAASVDVGPTSSASSVSLNSGQDLNLYLFNFGDPFFNQYPAFLVANVLPTGAAPTPFAPDICLDLNAAVILPLPALQPEATLVWSFTNPGGLAGTSIHFQTALLVPALASGYVTTDPTEIVLL